MANNSTILEEIAVGAGFTEAQTNALIKAFEVYEDRVATLETSNEALETLADSFGDLSSADENDTLVADAQGVYQVNAVT